MNNNEYCQQISFRSIVETKEHLLDNSSNFESRFYKIDFTINEDQTYIFRVVAVAIEPKPDPKISFLTTNSQQGDEIQLVDIFRVDLNNGICDILGETSKTKPKFCVCKGIKNLKIDDKPKKSQIETFERLKTENLFVILGSKNENCYNVCKNDNRTCEA